MGFNWLTNYINPQNVWGALKSGVSKIYDPVKKISAGIRHGRDYVDGLFDKASKFGVPSSLIDLMRDNPVYSTISDVIDIGSDIIEKDLPRLGSAVEDFVEHDVLQSHAPGRGGAPQKAIEAFQPVGSVSSGFTPNRNPTFRQNFTAGAATL